MACLTYNRMTDEFYATFRQLAPIMGEAAALAMINPSGGPARVNSDGSITICAPGDTLPTVQGPSDAAPTVPGGGTPLDPATVPPNLPDGSPVPPGARPLYPTIADSISQLIPSRWQLFGAATGSLVIGVAIIAFVAWAYGKGRG